MRLKHRVSFGGVQLDSLDSRILISGVEEEEVSEKVTAVTAAFGSGSRVSGRRRDSLKITVRFQLAIKPKAMAERSELLEKINAWAMNPAWLRLNYRPGRQIYCFCSSAPGGGDAFKMDQEYSIVFSAYSQPYWVDQTLTTITTKSGKERTVSLDVPGNTETVVQSVTVVNKSGAVINTLSIEAGSSIFEFSDLGMAANEEIVIDHPLSWKTFYLRIRKIGDKTVSIMGKRTETSSDDLYISPGKQEITIKAQRAVVATINLRGRYV